MYIKPLTPRLNGKVERSHRVDDEEFYRLLEGVVVDDSGVLNAKLREWEHLLQFRAPARSPGWPDANMNGCVRRPGSQCQPRPSVEQLDRPNCPYLNRPTKWPW